MRTDDRTTNAATARIEPAVGFMSSAYRADYQRCGVTRQLLCCDLSAVRIGGLLHAFGQRSGFDGVGGDVAELAVSAQQRDIPLAIRRSTRGSG
jgi:hypothetical protein